MRQVASGFVVVLTGIAAVAACKSPPVPPAANAPHADAPPPPPPPPDGPDAAAPPSPRSWRDSYDLDGDGTNDRIVSEFTGGAHCCYRLGAALSSTGTTVLLPFELDGGYVGGIDLSQPSRFTVRTRTGSLPELVYEIAVYNGEPQPLDPAWTRTWGVKSHRVALCFAGGNARASDDAPDLPPCR